MFFRRKQQLKKKYDGLLIDTMASLQRECKSQNYLQKLTQEETADAYAERKLAEAKYFYLFKEAKARNIRADLSK